MINHSRKKYLEKTYDLNLLDDIFFTSNRRVNLLFDLNVSPIMGHVISGDVTTICLPYFETIEARKLLDYVEPDNLLAEVEGKHIFVESIHNKFNNMQEELYIHIPIKRENDPLWVYLGFRRLLINNKHFIYGQVLRIFEQTPEEIIHYQKTHQDPLTKLFTRETLKKHIDYLENPTGKYLMYLDLDGFKQVNDLLGHHVGDQFLIDVANKFISNWERNVIYYRLGGDEFAIYCYDHDDESIKKRAQQVIDDIENLNEIAIKYKISISIGIVKITEENLNYHKLLNLGDNTMYKSKAKGTGKFTLYEE